MQERERGENPMEREDLRREIDGILDGADLRQLRVILHFLLPMQQKRP